MCINYFVILFDLLLLHLIFMNTNQSVDTYNIIRIITAIIDAWVTMVIGRRQKGLQQPLAARKRATNGGCHLNTSNIQLTETPFIQKHTQQ